MYRFGLFCSIAAWLVVMGQGLAPASAQSSGPCKIDPGASISASGNPMLPTPALLATQLESAIVDSCIVVRCTGTSSGIVRLSIVNGNQFALRLASTSGFFTTQSTSYSSGPINVPYSSSASQRNGEIRYQVKIVSPTGYYLPAGNNYTVKVNAAVICNSGCGGTVQPSG